MLLPLVAVGARLAQADGRGGRVPADLLPARAQPRQLPAALGLPGRAADLPGQQPRDGAADDRCSRSLLTVPAGYALARFPIPGKEVLFVVLLLALIVPYQALLTPDVPDVRQARADQLAARPGDRAHRDPAAVQPVRPAQQLRGGAAGAGGGGGHRRRRARPGRSLRRIFLPSLDAGDRDRRAVRVHHVLERVPRRAGDDEQGVRRSRCR